MAHPRDIWRVRIVKLDEFEWFDFEQYEDILYRAPQPEEVEILVNWRVDIVGMKDGEVRRSYEYGDDDLAARAAARDIRVALEELTPVEFADRYMVNA